MLAHVIVKGLPAPTEGMWNRLLTRCPHKVLKALFEARFMRWSVLLSLSKGQDVQCYATGRRVWLDLNSHMQKMSGMVNPQL